MRLLKYNDIIFFLAGDRQVGKFEFSTPEAAHAAFIDLAFKMKAKVVNRPTVKVGLLTYENCDVFPFDGKRWHRVLREEILVHLRQDRARSGWYKKRRKEVKKAPAAQQAASPPKKEVIKRPIKASKIKSPFQFE